MVSLLFPGCFSRVSTWTAVAVLTCFAAAQQANQPPPPAETAPVAAPVFWNGSDPNEHVVIPENALIRAMTNTAIDAGKTRVGSPVMLTLSQDVVVNHFVIVPRGATLHGTVVQSRKAGKLTGRAEVAVELQSLDLGGQNYPLYAYQCRVVGEGKGNPTDAIVDSAYYGALAAGVVNDKVRGESTATQKAAAMSAGAAIGAGAVTLIAVGLPGPKLSVPAETQMDFYLAAPVSVVPVTAKEAEQLSHRLPRGRPVLYVRGETP